MSTGVNSLRSVGTTDLYTMGDINPTPFIPPLKKLDYLALLSVKGIECVHNNVSALTQHF